MFSLTEMQCRILIDAFTPEQSDRYDFFKRAKLNKPTLRKIVNQTLSQSVPPNVITTISGYTKVFVGELIERARTVQEEWANIADAAAIAGAETEAREAEKQRRIKEEEETKKRTSEGIGPNEKSGSTPSESQKPGSKPSDPAVEIEETQSQNKSTPTPKPSQFFQAQTQTQSRPPSFMSSKTESVPPFKLPPNPHRAQLLPAHIREALRRYKRDCEGANVGFSGLSTNGLGVKGSFTWNTRGVGGRRIFR